ncbi:MAG: transcription elongation factor GreAB [Deltaproteobacteria bacterium RIFCSPLOWO2_12_FULL_43_16]|nr:MAG: transcription elongation factor GreAB [Deltaproteobacteria bacterium GWA2_43_19]OGQ09655.1 MAG: transcription elongation factor GreAB [Deltaproteobacteria bacterium RIFCSPHIGHO2_02_FULL_43_33]OGQ57471.1 MAG: transcription elongation factor GreAB [Deltaproteobacteria bacterium RIFCSPLOWO2_12_FULL_43_16]HBR17507.1 transcription elongation factor GreA [Deltaproteobacteria bacterium]
MHKLPIIKQLEEELKKVERELRIELPKEIRKAAAHGDLRENAEYHAAKERQTFLQARFAHLHTRINALSSINLNTLPKDKIAFGSKVFLEDLNTGGEVIYELVTPEDVDPKNGKISIASPIGNALLNKEVGDEVIIQLPTGKKEYSINKLITLHDMLKA